MRRKDNVKSERHSNGRGCKSIIEERWLIFGVRTEPHDFFADFKGYIHADCYQAYVTLGQQEHIHHVACWAHARRYFVDVAKAHKKQGLAHLLV